MNIQFSKTEAGHSERRRYEEINTKHHPHSPVNHRGGRRRRFVSPTSLAVPRAPGALRVLWAPWEPDGVSGVHLGSMT